MSVTHDEILALIATPWIEMGGGRKTIAKRSLPPLAHDPGPNVVVAALPTDKTALSVCTEFLRRHFKPRFNWAHFPSGFAWQFLAPGGERLLLFTWSNWQRNSRQMFEDFCRETGRDCGTLTLDGTITLRGKTIPFRACRLVYQDDLQPRAPASLKCKSARTIIAAADQLLRRRKSQVEEIDYRELSDEEAHDEELQEKLAANLQANLNTYEKALTKKYGPPGNAGPNEHRDLAINGVLRHVIWKVRRKLLYLALSHEEIELPWVIYLGVKV